MQQWGHLPPATLHLHGGVSGPRLKHQPRHVCVTAPGCAASRTKSTVMGGTDFPVLIPERWLRDGEAQLDPATRGTLFFQSPVE